MTRFYWLESQAQASVDATEKGYSSGEWIFCADKAALVAVDIADYEAIYMQTGVNELEREFACIMGRNRPSW